MAVPLPTAHLVASCILAPALATVLAALLGRIHEKAPPAVAISACSISLVSSALLLTSLWGSSYLELEASPLWAPGMPLFILLDPLSLLMAVLVSLIGLLILLYSADYMRHEPGWPRFWSLMSLFLASMLLLVLAGDLITMLVGWKLVGFCSYALISHYYTDEPERWVGGPPPEPMYSPSHCGLKALFTTTVGDVLMFSGIFLIYAYAGTLRLTAIYASAKAWLAALASTPGMLALTATLLAAGPLSKSAQFPFQEWLPEAMAGPTPVSALIHAATMVKAGVFVAARFLPIFYIGLHELGAWEASIFFLIVAYSGALTAILAAAEGCVSSELKKILAYSTMSQLGYMMLGLGAAGLMPDPAPALTATFYHLAAHAAFKSALFMVAGLAIHLAGSIYVEQMGGLRREIGLAWASSLVLGLSLIGLPPLSGFWGKEEILSACLASGLMLPFLLALLTVFLTAFYTIRMLGLVFHGPARGERHAGASLGHLASFTPALLAIISVVIGLLAPIIMPGLEEPLGSVLNSYLGTKSTASSALTSWHLPGTLASLSLLAAGALLAFSLYVRGRPRPEGILATRPYLRRLRGVLRGRLGLNSIYYAISGLMLRIRRPARAVEAGIDTAWNLQLPKAMKALASALRKIQTGHLGLNMVYLLAFLTAAIVLAILGVI